MGQNEATLVEKVGARRCRDRRVEGSRRTARRAVPTRGIRSGAGRGRTQMGSDTFSIPNEVRPHRVGGRLGEPSLPEAARSARSADPT